MPAALQDKLGASGDEFVHQLVNFDSEYENLRNAAGKEGKVLRYVGVIDVAAGVVKAALEPYVFPLMDDLFYPMLSCA